MAGLTIVSSVAPGEFDPWTHTARYKIEYSADLSSVAAAAGQAVRVWIPIPANSPPQRVLTESIESSLAHRVTTDSHGNRMVYVEYSGPTKATITIRASVQRSPYEGLKDRGAQVGSRDDPRGFLKPQSRIPLDGVVRTIALYTSRGLTTDAERIRAMYDYVTSHMRYSKVGKGWGQGDAIWACTEKYGNCTDFHSLLMGMSRSQGIPARFLMGFPIPADHARGEVKGYHCWAELYDRDHGWKPVDASEAWKAKRFNDYFGKLPSDRIEFSVGRDLVLSPPQAAAPLNYFIYPYAEVDGKPVEKVRWRLLYQRLDPRDESH